MAYPKVSVILPTYNEADNIELLLPMLKRVLEEVAGDSYEIIVVDDDSPDRTAEVALRVARDAGIADKVRVLVRRGERGLASAVIEGFKASKGEYLIVMDADLQHPPDKVKDICQELERGADVVVATRFAKGGRDAGLSLPRKILSKGASLVGKLLVPQIRPLSDPMSGFFGLRRSVIEGRLEKMRPRGFKILLEVMVKGKYDRRNVREVPIVFGKRARGESKLGASEVFDYLAHVLSLNEYRILKFMLVGVSGIFVNQGVLWATHYRAGLPLYLAGAAAIETSILSNFTLNSLVTFRGEAYRGTVASRLFKYHVATAVGAAINYATLLLLSHLLHVSPLTSNLIGILLGFLANYALSEHYVWERAGRFE